MNPIDPESLIYRFSKQLEFGPSTMQVASDAVRIVQRMNRDWMTTGRRPAGVCGAALILAARMNNFRRTVREVVYVVKVTEITINQRLNEFSSTESGELTVDQFRSVQLENSHDPPAFIKAREGRKPGRGKSRRAADTAAEIEDDLSEVNSTEPTPPPPQPRRVDADGFAVPDLPVDPALSATGADRQASVTAAIHDIAFEAGEEKAKPKIGRPKGSKNKPLPPPTAEQVASEDALEDEMTALLSKDSYMVESAAKPPEQPRKPVSDSTEIHETEFESDPEVSNCLLSAAEVEIKERIWVHENKDYLRTQQAKALRRALMESTARPGAARPRKRRRGRMGDVAYLEDDAEEGEGKTSRASTPAEATRRMLEHRGFSKKINYRLLESLFGEKDEVAKTESASASVSRSHSRSRSRSQSVASRRSASVEPAVKRPRLLTQSRSATRPAASPAPAPAAVPERGPAAQPALAAGKREPRLAANEEVVGEAPEPRDDYADRDPDDEYDDEEEEGQDADRVEAAFAGNYYDEESDYYSD